MIKFGLSAVALFSASYFALPEIAAYPMIFLGTLGTFNNAKGAKNYLKS